VLRARTIQGDDKGEGIAMEHPSFADIRKEFEESLVYIRNDITAIRHEKSTVNYTVALLIGCGCEMLAAGKGDRKHPEKILADLLPPGDWRVLGTRLYTALRDGLAHGFDTKHLEVEGKIIQIYISWHRKDLIGIEEAEAGLGVYIGIQPLAEGLCAKIDEFEQLLRRDEAARKRFKEACDYQRVAKLNQSETSTWRRLVAASGC
jgi:hypothetical protein